MITVSSCVKIGRAVYIAVGAVIEQIFMVTARRRPRSSGKRQKRGARERGGMQWES